MSTQTETQKVDTGKDVDLEYVIGLTAAYSLAMVDEIVSEKLYKDAQALSQHRRDRVSLDAYAGGGIDGGNERHKKLQEIRFLFEDIELARLEVLEETALRSLALATIERKRVEAEISLTKAWLYSKSGLSQR